MIRSNGNASTLPQYPTGRQPVVVQIQYVYSISRHHCSFYYRYMFRSLLDHLQVMFIYQNYKNYTYNAYITCL
jgi:hypothetical protein